MSSTTIIVSGVTSNGITLSEKDILRIEGGTAIDVTAPASKNLVDLSSGSLTNVKMGSSGGEYYLGVTCADVKGYEADYSIKTSLLAV